MTQRVNVLEVKPAAYKALSGLGAYLAHSPVDNTLLDLLSFRVSQINGCAFCLDMHAKDLRVAGETEQRLYMLNAWRETTLYTERERAALAWAEAVTLIAADRVPDTVYEEARSHFCDNELIDLTMAVVAINSYNRINVAFRMPAGDYQPGQFAAQAN